MCEFKYHLFYSDFFFSLGLTLSREKENSFFYTHTLLLSPSLSIHFRNVKVSNYLSNTEPNELEAFFFFTI